MACKICQQFVLSVYLCKPSKGSQEAFAIMSHSGTLYVVATPIGNLDDITLRAIETLQQVDLIAAEDTRHSKVLLQRLQINTPMVSHHDFSSEQAIKQIIDELQQGKSIALISDAGTPLISDPGYRLVSLAREQAIAVIPIPGPSAITAALSVAGLPTDRFAFEGFLPSKSAARLARLHELRFDTRSLIFYESTHRIVSSIDDMQTEFGPQRLLFVGRELTKKFETHFNGTISDCLVWLQSDANQQKGEFVIIVAGSEVASAQQQLQQDALHLVARLREHLPMKTAVALATELTGAKKNALYQLALEQERK